MLDDDPPVNTPDAAASDDEKPTVEVLDPAPPSGPSSTFSGGFAEPGTDNGKNTRDSLAKYNTDNPAGDEEGGGDSKPYEDDALYTPLIRGNGGYECSGSGTNVYVLASVGQIHDVFSEYEKTFGIARGRQKIAVTTLHNCLHSDTTAGSISRLIDREEPRVAADNGVTDTE